MLKNHEDVKPSSSMTWRTGSARTPDERSSVDYRKFDAIALSDDENDEGW